MREQGLAIDFEDCSTRSTPSHRWLTEHLLLLASALTDRSGRAVGADPHTVIDAAF